MTEISHYMETVARLSKENAELKQFLIELADDTERLMDSREPDVGTSLTLVIRRLRQATQ